MSIKNEKEFDIAGKLIKFNLESLIVEFDGASYVIKAKFVTTDLTVAEEDRTQFVGVLDPREYGFALKVNENDVELNYVTLNNISIDLEYKDYKIIKN